jgi:hypothetical protein
MAILAYVAAGVGNLGGTVSGVAEAPAALTNILHWIGGDKLAEDAELARLGAPPVPKALPAPEAQSSGYTRPTVQPPRRSSAPSWEAPKGGDLDDEIPF